MFILRNFTPYASTTVAPTGASAFTSFPQAVTSGASLVTRGTCVLLQNIGTVIVHFQMGRTTATATANSVALQPGCAMVFDTGAGDPFAPPIDGSALGADGLALFAPAGTGSINIAIGFGS